MLPQSSPDSPDESSAAPVVATEQPSTSAAIAESEDVNVEVCDTDKLTIKTQLNRVTAAEAVQVADVAPEQSVSEEVRRLLECSKAWRLHSLSTLLFQSVEVPAEPISESTPATEPDSVASESISPVEDGASQVDVRKYYSTGFLDSDTLRI